MDGKCVFFTFCGFWSENNEEITIKNGHFSWNPEPKPNKQKPAALLLIFPWVEFLKIYIKCAQSHVQEESQTPKLLYSGRKQELFLLHKTKTVIIITDTDWISSLSLYFWFKSHFPIFLLLLFQYYYYALAASVSPEKLQDKFSRFEPRRASAVAVLANSVWTHLNSSAKNKLTCGWMNASWQSVRWEKDTREQKASPRVCVSWENSHQRVHVLHTLQKHWKEEQDKK